MLRTLLRPALTWRCTATEPCEVPGVYQHCIAKVVEGYILGPVVGLCRLRRKGRRPKGHLKLMLCTLAGGPVVNVAE